MGRCVREGRRMTDAGIFVPPIAAADDLVDEDLVLVDAADR